MSLTKAIDDLLDYVANHGKTPDYGQLLKLDGAVYFEAHSQGLQDELPKKRDVEYRDYQYGRKWETYGGEKYTNCDYKYDSAVLFFDKTKLPYVWFCPPEADKILDLLPTPEWVEDMRILRAFAEAADVLDVKADKQPPTIWFHGGLSYSTDGLNPVKVSQEQHNVLSQFLDHEEAHDTKELGKAGASNVAVVMNKLTQQFGKKAVRRPTHKGSGYFIRVRSISTD